MIYRTLLTTPLLLIALLISAAAGEASNAPATPRFQAELAAFHEGTVDAETNLRRELGKAAPKDLVRFLNDLSQQGNAKDAAIASWYLEHSDQDVLVAAITTVGTLGCDKPATVDQLIRHLTDPKPLIRSVTLTAVANLRDDRCLPPLITLLNPQEPALAEKALILLRAQTGEKFPADQAEWQNWYDHQILEDQASYDRLVAVIATRNPRQTIESLHQLATLVTQRNRVLALMMSLAQHPDPGVRTTVDAYLHQLTGIPVDQPLSAIAERLQTTIPEIAAPVDVPVLAAPIVATKVIPVVREVDFFDTGLGLATLVGGALVALIAIVFFLRTPAGEQVKVITRRFAKKTGLEAAAKNVKSVTQRLARSPAAKAVGSATKRISQRAGVTKAAQFAQAAGQRMVKPLTRAIRKLDEGTRRLMRSRSPAATAPVATNGGDALEPRQPDSLPSGNVTSPALANIAAISVESSYNMEPHIISQEPGSSSSHHSIPTPSSASPQLNVR